MLSNLSLKLIIAHRSIVRLWNVLTGKALESMLTDAWRRVLLAFGLLTEAKPCSLNLSDARRWLAAFTDVKLSKA